MDTLAWIIGGSLLLVPVVAIAYPSQVLADWGTYLFISPLEQLYIHGPNIFGVGFWQGRELSAICAEISGPHVTQSFWAANPYDCEQMIGKRVDTFIVNVKLFLYAYIILRLFHAMVGCLTIALPTLIVRRLLRTSSNEKRMHRYALRET
jgi:hypothetical protein